MAATPTNTHPPHEGRHPETMGDNGRQDHFRAQEADHTNQHPPHEGRQPETMGDNGRQDHFRAQEADHTNQHPPLTSRETTGDNGRQRETRPLQSPRSRPHQPTPRRPDLKLHRTPTVNCLGKNLQGPDAPYHCPSHIFPPKKVEKPVVPHRISHSPRFGRKKSPFPKAEELAPVFIKDTKLKANRLQNHQKFPDFGCDIRIRFGFFRLF